MKRSLLVVVTLFAALLVLPTSKAWACSCAGSSPAEAVSRADVVFRGTMTRLEDPPSGALLAQHDPVGYAFTVAAVYKGRTERRVVVQSSRDGASCGLEGIEPGREYVVMAAARGGGYVGGLCDGTAPATDELVAAVEAAAGPGQQPVVRPAQPDPVTGAQPATPPIAATKIGGQDTLLWPVFGGLGMALLLGSGLVLARGHRRDQA